MRARDDRHASGARLDVTEQRVDLQLAQRAERHRPVVVDVPRATGDEPRPRRREEDEERAPVLGRTDVAPEQFADAGQRARRADGAKRRRRLQRLQVARCFVDPRRRVVTADAPPFQAAPHDVAHLGRGVGRERAFDAHVAVACKAGSVVSTEDRHHMHPCAERTCRPIVSPAQPCAGRIFP